MSNVTFFVRAGSRGYISHNNGDIKDWLVRKDLTFSSDERVVETKDTTSRETIGFRRGNYVLIVRKNDVRLSQDIKAVIQEGLRLLAGVCDGAATHDTVGFSGRDTAYGKILANAEYLSTKMVLDGARMLPKYHRQVPAPIVELARQLAPKPAKAAEKAE